MPGWATGAALGAALADPSRRIILFTGEGSHEMTATAIGTMGRYGLKPIIFVLNNDGYMVERALEADPNWVYNSGEDVLSTAVGCCHRIVGLYRRPSRFAPRSRPNEFDPLKEFSAACRKELLAMSSIV